MIIDELPPSARRVEAFFPADPPPSHTGEPTDIGGPPGKLGTGSSGILLQRPGMGFLQKRQNQKIF